MKKGEKILTDQIVIDLVVQPKKYSVWDRACAGFGVEVTPSGTKLMVAKTCATVIDNGAPKQLRGWHTLGTYGVSGAEWVDQRTGEPKFRTWKVDDYRGKAITLKGKVKDGEDPKAAVEAKKKAATAYRHRYTVNQLADRYIKDHMKATVTMVGERLVVTKVEVNPKNPGNRLSTAKEKVRLIEKFIRPAIGALPVEDVETDVINGLLQRIMEETPTQANRVRSLLSSMFKKAILWRSFTRSNPVTVQDRAGEKKRDRKLSDQEIQTLGVALTAAQEGIPYPAAAIRLALLTGMRKGEILGLQWDWIDLEAGLVTIPWEFHKTGGENQDDRVVMLCAAACAILRSLRMIKFLGNPYVIQRKGQAALVDLQSPWEEVRKAAKLDHKDDKKQVHFHDLRRTFSSVATRLGYSELWIGALLGHAAGTVTAGYARIDNQDDPLRKALEAIGARIAGLLDGSIDLKKEAEEAKKGKVLA